MIEQILEIVKRSAFFTDPKDSNIAYINLESLKWTLKREFEPKSIENNPKPKTTNSNKTK